MKPYTLILKASDIPDHKVGYDPPSSVGELPSSTGLLIDYAAIAIGENDSDDLWLNSIDWLDEQIEYARTSWLDSEDNTLTWLNKQTADNNTLPEYFQAAFKHDCNLLRGACLALHNADRYAEIIDWLRDSDYWDLETVCPPLAEVIVTAKTEAEADFRREWLHGDYHGNWPGLLSKIADYFSDYACEDVDYDAKDDTLIFTFTSKQEMVEYMTEWLGWTKPANRTSQANLTEWLAYCLSNDFQSQTEKRKTERDARRKERERVAAYQAEKKQAAEQARLEKLQAMTK